jgi:hypothetical protein
MTTMLARFAIPKPNANVFSMCARTARLGGLIGTTGLLGAHILSRPTTLIQCQGIVPFRTASDCVTGGVAPRHQFTQADRSLRVSQAPIDFQQLSSGSVLGLITGYLTAKIGRLFLFSFGGIFLLAAVSYMEF